VRRDRSVAISGSIGPAAQEQSGGPLRIHRLLFVMRVMRGVAVVPIMIVVAMRMMVIVIMMMTRLDLSSERRRVARDDV
jgi:hypothetical protein